MEAIATTKMSSKGQVVIPENVRLNLKLQEGTQFVVVGEGDVILLKPIVPPKMAEFSTLLAQVHKQAKQAGITKASVKRIIRNVRKRSKK